MTLDLQFHVLSIPPKNLLRPIRRQIFCCVNLIFLAFLYMTCIHTKLSGKHYNVGLVILWAGSHFGSGYGKSW